MKVRRTTTSGCYQRHRGFSLMELLVVLAIIGLLAALVLPALNRGHAQARRIHCVSNLEQLGRAFHLFAHDHNSRLPMQVRVADGGALEFVESGRAMTAGFYFAFRQFEPLSNELVTPKMLICPADTRTAVPRFATFNNAHLSFFINVRAEYARPTDLLSGDRNLPAPSIANPSILLQQPDLRYGWSASLHRFKGNALFTDGHVERLKHLPAGHAELFLPTTPAIGFPETTPAETTSTSNASSNTSNAPTPPANPVAETNTPVMNAPASPAAPPPRRATSARVIREMEPGATTQPPTIVANPPAPVSTPSSPPEVEEAEAPFNGPWFLTTAKRLVKTATGLTWLLLLLLLAVLLYLEWRRRQRAREKAVAEAAREDFMNHE